ncbi:hypothetical protein NLI96_g6809 [Meripilus lineatus]|uniref:Uncharacterized protein n=1 Tax=Meripilus lineatus TaxID=2056292 RepID=A0AAD5V534_9APHY|nr:hypothetical protein NLI96_g6809 [Physisporinus lineatus]
MSSHITTDVSLVRDLWSSSLPKLGTSHGSFEDIPKRYLVPSTLDETLFWVDVDSNQSENDKARTSYVLYHALPGPNGEGGDAEIQFHVQGFVVACNVHPLGTWRSSLGIESAPIAYQYLELCGLEATETFVHQVRALHALTRAVEITTGLQCNNSIKEESNNIRLWRKTFAKARPGKPIVSLLKRGDDVTGKARKMENMWYLDHRIEIHMQTENGKLAPLHHGLLGKGDFVDVLVNNQKPVSPVAETDKMDVEAVQKLAADIGANLGPQ